MTGGARRPAGLDGEQTTGKPDEDVGLHQRATLLLGGLASREAWGPWQALPWAEMIVETTGGVP